MCFSATASFTAGAALAPAGGYCVWSAFKNRDLRRLPLAMVPAFFGIQQFFEGMVWKTMAQGESGRPLVVRYSQAFLFFALFFWPVWLPFSSMILETRTGMRRFMGTICALGLILGLLLFWPVAADPERWLTTNIVCSSIHYGYIGTLLFQLLGVLPVRILYLIIGSLPMVLCADGVMRRFGAMLIASALISHAFFAYAYASIWCFFAAMLSGYLCWTLRPRPACSASGNAEGFAGLSAG
ncbi:MAG: DUF6629 family protein [Elusimicrobiota bacterium]|jgi:hypothetical protein